MERLTITGHSLNILKIPNQSVREIQQTDVKLTMRPKLLGIISSHSFKDCTPQFSVKTSR